MLTHAAVLASALASSRALEVDVNDHWLACLPLCHVGGLSVVTRALLTGSALTVMPGFDAQEVARAAHECNLVSLVPTALQRIDPRLFRTILLGGSRPHTPVLRTRLPPMGSLRLAQEWSTTASHLPV